MTVSTTGGDPRERSRRRVPRGGLPRRLGLAFAVHPRRAIALGGLGLLLVGIVATTSLPMALADRHPRLALMLYPDHPQALLTLAREERQALLGLAPEESQPALQPPEREDDATATHESAPPAAEPVADPTLDPAATTSGDTAPEIPPAPSDDLALRGATTAPDTDAGAAASAEIEARRAAIRDLAGRIVARAPLNAAGYRLLGDASEDPEVSRQAMLDAVARSRRETVAVFWLLQHDYEAQDYAGAVAMADALLRTRPVLNRFTLSYLYSLVLTLGGREALAAELVRNPSWRGVFFDNMGQSLATSDAPLELFAKLKQAGSPPTERELTPFIRRRMAADARADDAYNIWLQMLSDEAALKVRPVNNLDFTQDPTQFPFGWNVPRSVNAFVDLTPRSAGESGRALRVRFGVGQVKFGAVQQIAFLRPGTYRFSGEQKGVMSAKRGMRWHISCYPSGLVLGQSDQLLGAPRQWREFAFDFTVPADGGCTAQRVRLIHDARTTSEQFASGEISFQSLDIKPAPPADTPG